MTPRLLDIKLFKDKLFPELTIKKFVAQHLEDKVDEDKVIKVLYHALSLDQQNEANKGLIAKAIEYKVNASGAIILMVNTNEGLQLVYTNSQRRNKVVSTNGQCEAKESMADTALREFVEELGNPEEKSILRTIVQDPENLRSLALSNQIGKTPAEIAKRIVDKKADKNSLYINMSVVYVNSQPVNIRALDDEIKKLNAKLEKSAPYYTLACQFYYKKTTLTLVEKLEACETIHAFTKNCNANITSDFRDIFDTQYNSSMADAILKKALHAIIDLSENNKVSVLSKLELEKLLSLDFKKPETYALLKTDGYFFPSLQNILMNKGEQTAKKYLTSLERLASNVAKMSLGCLLQPSQVKTAEIDSLSDKSPSQRLA